MAALLTEEQGDVRAAVRGARGRTRKGAALQILTEVAVTYFRREGSDLARVDSLEIVRSSFRLATRPESAMLIPYFAESALTFVPESEPGSDVYRLTRHVLDALDEGADPVLAARYFEVWLLRFAGLLPEDESCAVCGDPLPPGPLRLDPEVPGFASEECAGPRTLPVPANARALLTSFKRAKLTELARRKGPDADALESLESLSREVRRRFLGHELKSYRFLRSLG